MRIQENTAMAPSPARAPRRAQPLALALPALLAFVSACGAKNDKPTILYPKPAPTAPKTPLGQTSALATIPLTLSVSLLQVPTNPAGKPAVTYDDVKGIFDAHSCTGCHGDEGKGGLTLLRFPFEAVDDDGNTLSQATVLDNILGRVQRTGRGRMPPKGMPGLDATEVAKLAQWKADGIQGPAATGPLTSSAAKVIKSVHVLFQRDGHPADFAKASPLTRSSDGSTYTGKAADVPMGSPSVLLVVFGFLDGSSYTAVQPKSVVKADAPVALSVTLPSTALPAAAPAQ